MKNSRHPSDNSNRPSINFLRSSNANTTSDPPPPTDIPVEPVEQEEEEEHEEEHHDHESLNASSHSDLGKAKNDVEHLREYASDVSLNADSHSDLGKAKDDVHSLHSDPDHDPDADLNAGNDSQDDINFEDEDLNMEEFALVKGEMGDGDSDILELSDVDPAPEISQSSKGEDEGRLRDAQNIDGQNTEEEEDSTSSDEPVGIMSWFSPPPEKKSHKRKKEQKRKQQKEQEKPKTWSSWFGGGSQEKSDDKKQGKKKTVSKQQNKQQKADSSSFDIERTKDTAHGRSRRGGKCFGSIIIFHELLYLNSSSKNKNNSRLPKSRPLPNLPPKLPASREEYDKCISILFCGAYCGIFLALIVVAMSILSPEKIHIRLGDAALDGMENDPDPSGKVPDDGNKGGAKVASVIEGGVGTGGRIGVNEHQTASATEAELGDYGFIDDASDLEKGLQTLFTDPSHAVEKLNEIFTEGVSALKNTVGDGMEEIKEEYEVLRGAGGMGGTAGMGGDGSGNREGGDWVEESWVDPLDDSSLQKQDSDMMEPGIISWKKESMKRNGKDSEGGGKGSSHKDGFRTVGVGGIGTIEEGRV